MKKAIAALVLFFGLLAGSVGTPAHADPGGCWNGYYFVSNCGGYWPNYYPGGGFAGPYGGYPYGYGGYGGGYGGCYNSGSNSFWIFGIGGSSSWCNNPPPPPPPGPPGP